MTSGEADSRRVNSFSGCVQPMRSIEVSLLNMCTGNMSRRRSDIMSNGCGKWSIPPSHPWIYCRLSFALLSLHAIGAGASLIISSGSHPASEDPEPSVGQKVMALYNCFYTHSFLFPFILLNYDNKCSICICRFLSLRFVGGAVHSSSSIDQSID